MKANKVLQVVSVVVVAWAACFGICTVAAAQTLDDGLLDPGWFDVPGIELRKTEEIDDKIIKWLEKLGEALKGDIGTIWAAGKKATK